MAELVDKMRRDDAGGWRRRWPRDILLGADARRRPRCLPPLRPDLLRRHVRRRQVDDGDRPPRALAEQGYQFCIIDPEGDYDERRRPVLGNPSHAPAALLEDGGDRALGPTNVIVNLLGLPLADRPAFFEKLLPRLELRRTGRPHWLVIDEAHHLLPEPTGGEQTPSPPTGGLLLITVHPDQVARA